MCPSLSTPGSKSAKPLGFPKTSRCFTLCFVQAASRAWYGILFTVSCARQKHPLVISSKEAFLRHLDCSLPSCQPPSPRISTSLPTLPVCPLHPHQGSPVDPRPYHRALCLARTSYSCPLVSAGGWLQDPLKVLTPTLKYHSRPSISADAELRDTEGRLHVFNQ